MTEAELRELEDDPGTRGNPVTDTIIRLCTEVRACWAAIHDLRQDSTAYRRAIVDAVRLIAATGICNTLSMDHDTAAVVADLALTEDEFHRVWEGEPVPLGVVYDAKEGFFGDCFDAETGEHLHDVVRACPEQGWYETRTAEGRGLITRRHWRKVRVEPYEKVKT